MIIGRYSDPLPRSRSLTPRNVARCTVDYAFHVCPLRTNDLPCNLTLSVPQYICKRTWDVHPLEMLYQEGNWKYYVAYVAKTAPVKSKSNEFP
jgi:hypothetical protein